MKMTMTFDKYEFSINPLIPPMLSVYPYEVITAHMFFQSREAKALGSLASTRLNYVWFLALESNYHST